jgi:hypothetical protein
MLVKGFEERTGVLGVVGGRGGVEEDITKRRKTWRTTRPSVDV